MSEPQQGLPPPDEIDDDLLQQANKNVNQRAVQPVDDGLMDYVVQKHRDEMQQAVASTAAVAVTKTPEQHKAIDDISNTLGVGPKAVELAGDKAKHAASLIQMGLGAMAGTAPGLAAWLSSYENAKYAHEDASSGELQSTWKLIQHAASVGSDIRLRSQYRYEDYKAGIDPDTDTRITMMSPFIEAPYRDKLHNFMLTGLLSSIENAGGSVTGFTKGAAAAGAMTLMFPEAMGLTVPAGLALGGAIDTAQQEAGENFHSVTKRMKARGKLDIPLAQNIASVVGAANGILEVADTVLLFKLMPGLKGLFAKEVRRALVGKSLGRVLTRAGLGYAGEILSESVTEGLQGGVAELGAQVAVPGSTQADELRAAPGAFDSMNRDIPTTNYRSAPGTDLNWGEVANAFTDNMIGALQSMPFLILPGASLNMYGHLQGWSNGVKSAQQMRAEAEQVQKLKMAKVSPQKLGEMAETAAKEVGHPDTVFISTDGFKTLYQTDSGTPLEAAQGLGIEQEYTDAVGKATGWIAVPYKKYISDIATSAEHEKLRPDMKYDLDDMTLNEGKKFKTEVWDEFRKLADTLGTEQEVDDIKTSDVYTERKRAALDAGQPEAVAHEFGYLHASYAKVLEAYGHDLLKEFPLVVVQGEVEEGESAAMTEMRAAFALSGKTSVATQPKVSDALSNFSEQDKSYAASETKARESAIREGKASDDLTVANRLNDAAHEIKGKDTASEALRVALRTRAKELQRATGAFGTTLTQQAHWDTREFKLFFEGASFAVKDEFGNPKFFFRGGRTSRDELGRPLRALFGMDRILEENKMAVWATDDPGLASDYAITSAGDVTKGYYVPGRAAQVYPLYFALRNPLVVDAKGTHWDSIPLREVPHNVMDLAKHFNISQFLPASKIRSLVDNYITDTDDIAGFASLHGYDGVVFQNVIDPANELQIPATTIVAFDPNDVKGAVGNNGAYSLFVPNILRQSANETVSRFALPAVAKRWLDRALNRKESVGQPEAERTELQLADGSTFVVGKITPEDWVSRWVGRLTPTEIQMYSKWYRDVRLQFVSKFGEEEGLKFMAAWMLANQNTTTDVAMLNALRAREQLAAPKRGAKRGGLAHDRVTEFWKVAAGLDAPTESLGGPKLYDFLDAGLGNQTRTWVAGDQRGGQPVPIDVWSARDVGFITPVLKQMLAPLLKDDAERAKLAALPLDIPAGDKGGDRAVSETQYEYGANFLRQAHLLMMKRGFLEQGSSASESQAIGWMGFLGLAGSRQGTAERAILSRMHSFSTEAMPGEGAPLAASVEPLRGLPLEAQVKATKEITDARLKAAMKIVGVAEPSVSVETSGYGGWFNPETGRVETNPAATYRIVVSDERSAGLAAAIGYLGQQSEMWDVAPASPGFRGRRHIGIEFRHPDFKDPAKTKAFWSALARISPELATGFSPTQIDGTSAIVSLRGGEDNKGFTRDAADAEHTRLDSFTPQAVIQAAQEAGFIGKVEVTYSQHRVTVLTGKWGGKHAGETYLKQVASALGRRAQDSLVHVAAEVDEQTRKIVSAAVLKHAEAGANANDAVARERDRAPLGVSGVREEGAPAAAPAAAGRSQGRGPEFNAHAQQEDAVRVEFVHYTHVSNLQALDPSFAGTGAGGEQIRRLGPRHGKRGGIASRVYMYARQGDALPTPERAVSGAYAYQGVLTNVYDTVADPRGLRRLAKTPDQLEEMVSAAGFDGMLLPEQAGMNGSYAVAFNLGQGVTIPVTPAESPVHVLTLLQTEDEDEEIRNLLRDFNTPEKEAELAEKMRAAFEEIWLDKVAAKKPLGALQYLTPTTGFRLTLTPRANRSTLLHETAHYFTAILFDIAQRENAPQALKDDAQALLKWFGVKDFSQVRSTHHEKLAHAFEKWFMQGKAPSAELVRTFARYSRWLKSIYSHLKNHPVNTGELPDEIARVFGRFVATDDQILQFEAQQKVGPMFENAEEAGMTDEQFTEYQALVEEAHNEARIQIENGLKAEEEEQAKVAMRKERAEVKDQVTKEVDARPEIQASTFLSTGIAPEGADLNMLAPDGKPLKISESSLDEMYGDDAARVKKRLGPNAITKEGGVHPDAIGLLFGFGSGDEMIRAITGNESRSRQIAGEVRARMAANHGDAFADLPTAATAAVMDSKKRMRQLQVELDRLNKKAGRAVVRVDTSVLSEYADEKIKQANVRDIIPYRFLVAERKAATDAIALNKAGKFEEAVLAQKRRMLNRFLYSAAVKAKKEADAAVKFLKKADSPSQRAKLGKADVIDPSTGQITHSHLDQQDKLLERFEFRPATQETIRARKALQAFIEFEVANNRDPLIAPKLLNEAYKVNWKDMTLQDLLDLRDAVTTIRQQANRDLFVILAGKEILFSDAVRRGLETILKNVKQQPPTQISETAGGFFKLAARDPIAAIEAELLRLYEQANELDGDDPNGIFHQMLIHPLDDNAADAKKLTKEVTKKLLAAIDKLSVRQRAILATRETTLIPSINQRFTMADMIAFALNLGNESNEFKMFTGWQTRRQGNTPWTETTIAEMRAQLTEEHWDLVQSLWDALEDLWPAAEALERRMTGLNPKKVEARAFTITRPDGTTKTYRGGYYPVIYHPLYKIEQLQAPVGVGGILYDSNHDRVMTPHGHLMDRVETYSAPVSLKFSRMLGSIQNVIHDTTHRETLINAMKFLSNQQIADAIIQHKGEPYYRAMVERVRRVANSSNQVSAFLNVVHTTQGAVAAAYMGFKLSVIFQNLANFILAKQAVGTLPLMKAMGIFMISPARTTAMMHEKSSVMRYRTETRDNEVRQAFELTTSFGKVGLVTRPATRMAEMVRRLGYKAMVYSNIISEAPTWLAAYQSAQKRGLTDEQASRVGDDIVKTYFGSGEVKDLALVQDTEAMKPLTMFYGFASAFTQMARQQSRIIGREWRTGHKIKASLHTIEFLLFNMIMFAGASEVFSGRAPDDDDDLTEWLAEQAKNLGLSMIPLGRDVNRYIDQKVHGGARGVQITPLTAPAELLGDAITASLEVAKDLWDGEPVEIGKVVKPTVELLAMYQQLPVSQTEITGGYVWDLMTNKESPETWGEFFHKLAFRRKKRRRAS